MRELVACDLVEGLLLGAPSIDFAHGFDHLSILSVKATFGDIVQDVFVLFVNTICSG